MSRSPRAQSIFGSFELPDTRLATEFYYIEKLTYVVPQRLGVRTFGNPLDGLLVLASILEALHERQPVGKVAG